jgi:Protein of unknown function (DUF3047)
MVIRLPSVMVFAASIAALQGCASGLAQPDVRMQHTSAWRNPAPWTLPADTLAPMWQHFALPGKTPTTFKRERVDGRDAVNALAQSSASLLRHKVRIAPADLHQVRFSWKVPQLIDVADMALRELDDSPVRIVLAFEGDKSTWSMRNTLLDELSRTLTGEEIPYATLMYVWCNKRAPGSVIVNPRTDRIRTIAVESGAKNLNQWLDYERDIRADYQKAFGEPPGALTGIAIMTDSDNTQSQTNAWYGAIQLTQRSVP